MTLQEKTSTNVLLEVGGSLAGLMTSISLRRLGHNVKIFERSSTPLLHDQGAGIVAGGETQAFLHWRDKSKTPSSVPSHFRLYLNKDGNIIHEESMTQHMTSWDLLYYVCRANFDNLKTEYIKGDLAQLPSEGEGDAAYQYGREVTNLEKEGEQVKVSFHSTIAGENQDTMQHELADFVIIADGASSVMRRKLCPSSPPRTYAGYVAFRGTVPESELSTTAQSVFVEKFAFFHSAALQILAYVIPGVNGSLAPGRRKVNWVWYWNVADDTDEYRQIMTDKNGTLHRWTLPPGNNMSTTVWDRQKQRAEDMLAPQFAELVTKTTSPFVQAIMDLEPPADGVVWVLDGKGVLVGDCVAGFRPHTAASTSQAALHALTLPGVFVGDMTRAEYEHEIMHFATMWQKRGVMLGNRSQFGHHPLA